MKQQPPKLIATFICLLLLAFVSINAQAQYAEKVVVNIPFQFSVGGEQFPAGEYTVKPTSQINSCFTIQSRRGRAATIVLAPITLQGNQRVNQARVVFHRYKNLYFLSQVWMPDSGSGNQVTMSGAERALRRELAGNNSSPQQITLLTRQR